MVDFRLWLLFVEHDLNPAEYDVLFVSVPPNASCGAW